MKHYSTFSILLTALCLFHSIVIGAPFQAHEIDRNEARAGKQTANPTASQARNSAATEANTSSKSVLDASSTSIDAAVNSEITPKASTGSGNGATAASAPSAAEITAAVLNWQKDTGIVSNFLNTGKELVNNEEVFKAAAKVAFDAEVDELTSKAVLDQAFPDSQAIKQADSVLVGKGVFQQVVDDLNIMATQGTAEVARIDKINANRCVDVLPNIDMYFQAAGQAQAAVRPAACGQNNVLNANGGNAAADASGQNATGATGGSSTSSATGAAATSKTKETKGATKSTGASSGTKVSGSGH